VDEGPRVARGGEGEDVARRGVASLGEVNGLAYRRQGNASLEKEESERGERTTPIKGIVQAAKAGSVVLRTLKPPASMVAPAGNLYLNKLEERSENPQSNMVNVKQSKMESEG